MSPTEEQLHEWLKDSPRKQLYLQIDHERICQDDIWGGQSHDDMHHVLDWVAIHLRYLAQVGDADMKGWKEYFRGAHEDTSEGRQKAKSKAMTWKLEFIRRRFLKLAAISVAAVEWSDRKLELARANAE